MRELTRTRLNLALIQTAVEVACEDLGVPSVAPFIFGEIKSTLRELESSEAEEITHTRRRSTKRDAEGARRELAGLDRAIEHNFARLEGKRRRRSSQAGVQPADIKPMVKAVAAPGARRLIYSFLALPHPERERIARELGLLDAGDERSAEDFKLYELIFARAKARGLLDELGEMVKAASGEER